MKKLLLSLVLVSAGVVLATADCGSCRPCKKQCEPCKKEKKCEEPIKCERTKAVTECAKPVKTCKTECTQSCPAGYTQVKN